jgi:hypothetical protein
MGNKEYKSQSCEWKTSVKKHYYYIYIHLYTQYEQAFTNIASALEIILKSIYI